MLRNVLLQQEDAFNDRIILKGNLLQEWSTWVKTKKNGVKFVLSSPWI